MMEQQGQFSVSQMIESLNGWWDLAGVDAAVDNDAVDWLALDAKPETIAAPPSLKAAKPEIMPVEASITWPTDIDTLRSMLPEGAALPGTAFGNRRAVSVGPQNAALMIISDLPDAEELAVGHLGCGTTGGLLKNMLTAIGVDLADCYWATLASTVPAAGDLPDTSLPELAAFVQHQVTLVRPTSVIMLGSSACRALLGMEMMEARGNLQNLNHNDAKVSVLTTFHPRTLIARPQMKAQAWKDLQMFVKRTSSE